MTGDTLLAQRYGRRQPRSAPRALLIALGVFVVAAVAWAGWVGVDTGRIPVRWTDSTFTLVDDGQARFRFLVTTAPGRTAVCTIRIFNSGLTEVGRIDVPAGPSPERTFAVTTVVPTFEAGNSGSVRACAVR